jgi:hypothetical protein
MFPPHSFGIDCMDAHASPVGTAYLSLFRNYTLPVLTQINTFNAAQLIIVH